MQGLSPMGNRYRYLIVAAYMIMSLFEIVCCSQKVGSCNPCKDFLGSGDPHVTGCLSPQKFLFDPYFGKYDDHIELKIKDLFGEEFLLSESCEEAVHRLRSLFKLTVIERHLIGEGSHRRLLSSLKFDCPSDAISVLEDHFCEAVVIERLPLGVFADPFELSHLVQRGVFQDAAVFGDTNLELPSALSNRSIVEAHVKIGIDNISGQNRGLEVSIELPLHIRYPPLGAGGGYLGIEMGGLQALVRCRSRAKLSQWILFGWDVKPSSSLIWQVPRGDPAHAEFVSVITFVSALVSALLIFYSAISYHSLVDNSKDS